MSAARIIRVGDFQAVSTSRVVHPIQIHHTQAGKCDAVLFTYKWIISNYANWHTTKDSGHPIESPLFTIKTDKELKWRLLLYPNGIFTDNKEFLSLYLRCEGSDYIEASFTLYAFDKNNKRIAVYDSGKAFTFFNCFSRGGTARFMHKDEAKSILKDDTLTIYCDVSIDVERCKIMKNNYKYELELQYRELTEMDNLEKLMESEKFCDVTLDVNGQIFRAHKCILASKSSVFAAMFEHSMREKTDNKVEIEGIDHDVFKELLRFVYAGKVNEIENVADGLLAAADKYSLEGLKRLCEETLSSHLSKENAVEYLKHADIYNAENLKKQAIDYIVANVDEMLDLPEFKSIYNLHSSVMHEVVCSLSRKRKHTEVGK